MVQGQADTPLAASGPISLTNAGVFLKYVLEPGALQDKPRPSIATEFGPLLPGINGDPGLGFSWAGILSQGWDWGTIHFNVEINLTRDQHAELFLDAIIEGPFKWPIRPVAEVFYDNDFGVAQEFFRIDRCHLAGAGHAQPRHRVTLCAHQQPTGERVARRSNVRISAQSDPTNER